MLGKVPFYAITCLTAYTAFIILNQDGNGIPAKRNTPPAVNISDIETQDPSRKWSNPFLNCTREKPSLEGFRILPNETRYYEKIKWIYDFQLYLIGITPEDTEVKCTENRVISKAKMDIFFQTRLVVVPFQLLSILTKEADTDVMSLITLILCCVGTNNIVSPVEYLTASPYLLIAAGCLAFSVLGFAFLDATKRLFVKSVEDLKIFKGLCVSPGNCVKILFDIGLVFFLLGQIIVDLTLLVWVSIYLEDFSGFDRTLLILLLPTITMAFFSVNIIHSILQMLDVSTGRNIKGSGKILVDAKKISLKDFDISPCKFTK